MDNKLSLGVSCKVITPAVGCQLYGYRPDIMSNAVNDDLTVTAFYFKQNETQALMISATVCLINSDLSDEILSEISSRYGIPKQNCLLHATHTHSGPNVAGTYGWGDIDRDYCSSVFIPRILEAVKDATENVKPVKMAVTYGESLVGINRRELRVDNRISLGQNPWGPFDPKMTLISFVDTDHKPVANIVHYGAHGTAAGANHEISRDWSGVMTDAITAEFGGITAFFNGPEGDVGPRLTNGKTVGDIGYAMRLGAVAAQDAVRIRKNTTCYTDAELKVSEQILNIPLDPRIPLETAKADYEPIKDKTVNSAGARANYLRTVIKSYEEGYTDLKSLPVSQTVIRIGDVAFIGFSYELFSEIGMRIAKASPVPYALSLSNTNGSSGYFVTEDQICRGGYEIDMFKTAYIQPYSDNADWQVITQTLEHLNKPDK